MDTTQMASLLVLVLAMVMTGVVLGATEDQDERVKHRGGIKHVFARKPFGRIGKREVRYKRSHYPSGAAHLRTPRSQLPVLSRRQDGCLEVCQPLSNVLDDSSFQGGLDTEDFAPQIRLINGNLWVCVSYSDGSGVETDETPSSLCSSQMPKRGFTRVGRQSPMLTKVGRDLDSQIQLGL